MTKTMTKGGKKAPVSGKLTKRSAGTGKFVLGRTAFTSISAVEGIAVSKSMSAALSRTAGMPAAKRRKTLASKYGKK